MPVEFDPSQFSKAVRVAALKGVVRGTEIVRAEMVRLILRGEKTGAWYGMHQASAPGEAPASDTGRLAASLSTTYDAETLTGKVVVGVNYGYFLEFGTAKMEPRPFIRPALENTRDQVTKAIAEEIGRVATG